MCLYFSGPRGETGFSGGPGFKGYPGDPGYYGNKGPKGVRGRRILVFTQVEFHKWTVMVQEINTVPLSVNPAVVVKHFSLSYVMSFTLSSTAVHSFSRSHFILYSPSVHHLSPSALLQGVLVLRVPVES